MASRRNRRAGGAAKAKRTVGSEAADKRTDNSSDLSGNLSRKRLARAKVVKGGKDGKKRSVFKPTIVDRMGGKKRTKEIAVAVFAVIIGVSMMLPSLAYIFTGHGPSGQGSNSSQSSDSTNSSESASDDGGSTGSGNTDSSNEGAKNDIASIDDRYQKPISSLEDKLASATDDTSKLPTLLGLGDDYLQWALAASRQASDDAGKAHVSELYGKAIDYYRQYLAINDSGAVKVKISQCQLYRGDTDAAVQTLEALTQASPDYGPAWVYLGVTYAQKGDNTKAINALKRAEAADPNDEYGAKTLAQKYEEYLASRSNPSGSTTGATGSGSSGGMSLVDRLNSGMKL
jgi:hypothetical protein